MTTTIRDSAYIQFVATAAVAVGLASTAHNLGAQRAAPATWTIAATPTIVIGSDADERAVFSRASAVRVPTGEIVVEDNATAELRVFSAAGRFVRNLSRRGSGPGEYQTASLVARTGDTIVVVENPPGARQIHVFTSVGGFVRKMPLRADNAPRGISVRGRLADGSYFVAAGAGFKVLDPNLRPGVVSRDSLTLGIYAPGDPGQVAWIGSFPNATQITYSSPFLKGQTSFMNARFGPYTVSGVSGNQVWFGDSDTGEITIYAPGGGSPRKIPAPIVARPLNESAVDLERARAVAAAATDNARAIAEAQFANAARPRTAPRFTSFVPGIDGEMWISLFDETSQAPTRFLVLDRLGVPKANVSIAPNVTIADIGRDWVLGRLRDPDGVESVALFRLTR